MAVSTEGTILHVSFDLEKSPILYKWKVKYSAYGIKKRIQELLEKDLKTLKAEDTIGQ